MSFSIKNEYASLKRIVLCLGEHIPDPQSYQSSDPEYTKYHDPDAGWEQDLLLRQQERLIKLLEKEGVKIEFVEADPDLPWQMFVRDVAFVVGEKLCFNRQRLLKERKGEVKKLLARLELSLESETLFEITQGSIEGGDVMPTQDICLVGDSSRTSPEAIEKLNTQTPVRSLSLGNQVMHLDTRLTVLSERHILAYMPAFTEADQAFLRERYEIIEVTEAEMKRLGTNVFMVHPDLVIVEEQDLRIQAELRERGFHVEALPYSEPIKLGGSFRCTTLPLRREA